jgi:hypothetical protein
MQKRSTYLYSFLLVNRILKEILFVGRPKLIICPPEFIMQSKIDYYSSKLIM